MFNISNLLNSLDNAAKETLQEGEVGAAQSATSIRSLRRGPAGDVVPQESHDRIESLASAEASTGDALVPPPSTPIVFASGDGGVGELPLTADAAFAAASIKEGPVVTASAPFSSSFSSTSSSTSSSSSSAPGVAQMPASNATAPLNPPAPAAAAAAAAAAANTRGAPPSRSADSDAEAEIERLNAECLELEDQVAALKTEVQEAWSSYQGAQDKAAARESELQDELRSLQRAKKSDKQATLGQMAKLGEDRDEALKGLRAAQQERQEALDALHEAQRHAASWAERERELGEELAEARMNSMQGAQGLRDDLRAAAAVTEQMRIEHASLMRQSQHRQAQLEEANRELVQGLADKQRELGRLQASAEGGRESEATQREVSALQAQQRALSKQLEEGDEARRAVDLRCRQIESDHRAQQHLWEDERSQLEGQLAQSAAAVSALEGRLRAAPGGGSSPAAKTTTRVYGGQEGEGEGGAFVMVGLGKSPSASGHEEEIRNLVAQVQALSRQLLSKQGSVNELTAERSALKSRALDLQARLSACEKQLTALRDLEEDDVDKEALREYQTQGYSSSSSLSSGLQRRRGGKVLTDLESMGVHAGPGIANVVNSIDTWTLGTGRLLRSYPLIRLGFVLYLLVLHLWVLVVLGWQTHELGEGALADRVNNRRGPR